MLKKIISSGQTGANRAGVDAAIANGFPYGGWIPRGRITETGPLPATYIMQEMPRGGYPICNLRNILDSDGTAILTHGEDFGLSASTQNNAAENDKPCVHLDLQGKDANAAVTSLTDFIHINTIETLNISGQSASNDPEIYQAVYQVIDKLLKQLNQS